jgi:lysophospholipase L1-like esterase
MRRLAVVLVIAVVVAASCSRATDDPTTSVRDPAPHWVSTWAASTQPADPPIVVAAPGEFRNQTIRQIVRVSIGGSQLRVRFSNEYGTAALRIGAAHVARQATGAGIVAGTDRVLTFQGRTAATVPQGSLLLSDPVRLDAPPASDIAVSLFLPVATPAHTFHARAGQTNYISGPGNSTAAIELPVASTTDSWFFLNEITVKAPSDTTAVVALGDSITNGFESTVDANRRWPNLLAERLQVSDEPAATVGVVNHGIDGNRLRTDGLGPSALTRFDRDVLATPGARFVVLLEGINDIGLPGVLNQPEQAVSAEQIIAGYQQLIDRAHDHGLKIFGGTLTPFEGTVFPGYFTPAGEDTRARVNDWIRTSGRFDAVIDFDAATRDPAHPTRLLPAYDSGDHLHPNDAGYAAMADAIDLRLFSEDS